MVSRFEGLQMAPRGLFHLQHRHWLSWHWDGSRPSAALTLELRHEARTTEDKPGFRRNDNGGSKLYLYSLCSSEGEKAGDCIQCPVGSSKLTLKYPPLRMELSWLRGRA